MSADLPAEQYDSQGRAIAPKTINFNVVGDRTYIVVQNRNFSGRTVNLVVRTSELKMLLIKELETEEEV